MLDRLIRFSLEHRPLILGLAVALLLFGGAWAWQMPVDIFPDLSRPTVTVITEAPGLAPEEVELLVSFPLEAALNGTPGLARVRSISGSGISVIWVEFEWGQEIYQARQLVTERLQRVELPGEVERPELGPMSSIMREITFLAVTSETVGPLELRRLVETVVRRNLLALPGVSQVVPIGGEERQYQVELDPARLAQAGVSVQQVVATLRQASRNPAAGFHVDGEQEYLVRGLGRVQSGDELAAAVVKVADSVPVTVGQLGSVQVGPAPRRGAAGYSGREAVVLSVQKQPEANTLELTRRLDEQVAELQRALPEGVVIESENFRQADFIEVAIHNVSIALRDGAVLVVLILLLFLGDLRATAISALAIPLSLVAGVLVVSALGGSINTMTLGGLTIAIGALVDDAIIDVENVLRRLRLENRLPADQRRPPLEVVFQASSEVRQAILFATLIIAVVFLPIFLLPGIEGRLLQPLGIAYVAALAASLVISVTVTPVLCYLLLTGEKREQRREPWLLARLQRLYQPSLDWALAHRWAVLAMVAVALAAAIAVLPLLGRSFLPPFNEGSLTVSAVTAPGITLEESDALGDRVEEALLSFPEVISTSRRTGRAERDEHVLGVNASEIEVVLRPGRPKEELVEAMRRRLAEIPAVAASFGQPISHRIDHMISGSRTNLAVKIFGPDLSVLRGLSRQVEDSLSRVPGVVDLSNQEQAAVPQLAIDFDRRALARYGLTAGELSDMVAVLFQGLEVGEVLEEGLVSPIVVRFPERLRVDREALADLPITLPDGRLIRLDDVADLRFDLGPGLIRRENVQRLAMVTANVAGGDLAGTVERARERVSQEVELPDGYLIRYGGQFEEAVRAVRNLSVAGVLIFVAMFGLLYLAFRNTRHTLVVLVNLPLALIGGLLAVALGDRIVSIASLVGFVTLFGIATRNGVLLVSHYQHLLRQGLPLAEAVRRGSIERLAPILMTALTAGLALIPLILAGGEPGNEIQSPMARVILGGLLTSTFLNVIVVPVLFAWWGGERAPEEAPVE